MLDIFEERALFFRRAEALFLRFGRSFAGAVGTECNATGGEDSAGVSGAGASDAVELCASPLSVIPSEKCGAEFKVDSWGFASADGAILCVLMRPSIPPRPKANLTMAPYHFNMESAVSSHSAAGVGIAVGSAVSVSRSDVPDSRCSDLIEDSSGALTAVS
jgi:hypothetical protein